MHPYLGMRLQLFSLLDPLGINYQQEKSLYMTKAKKNHQFNKKAWQKMSFVIIGMERGPKSYLCMGGVEEQQIFIK